eukprot:CAMPEP_0176444280 /NCGR_PEP_ID=MMETSP0127-20121128/22964_1 /TAXON_ID=938130 /ORGANISM="Platyophrya macrostoma, Strain WH" /LENGTH=240 /DNA_ID=CAMNT_0017829749 /DNA_START=3 /DNA_END=725 /DNA_ORIENTATION=+
MEDIAVVDFSKLKKKKKPTEEAEEHQEAGNELANAQLIDFSKTKKKKAGKDTQEEGAKDEPKQITPAADKKTEEANNFQDPFTYDLLLNRIYDMLKANNPTLGEKTKLVLKPPQVVKMKGKRTAWVNFGEICEKMHRPTDHVCAFMLAELGTEGSVDGEKMILKDKQLVKNIENLLKKYITEYVTCSLCKSPNTELVRDNSTRLHFMKCNNCKSDTRSVATIKAGYHALVKGDRQKAKNA